MQEKLDRVPKGDILVIMGDFNANVCCTGRKETAIGGCGLDERHEAEERLTEFSDTNEHLLQETEKKIILGPPQMGSIRIR